MSTKRAFTLMESLLALFLFSLSIELFLQLFDALNTHSSDYSLRQNRLGLMQLRRIVSLGLNHHVDDDELCMGYQMEETCFYQYENFLMQEPGTQYYLIQIDELYFTLQENRIYIHYRQADEDYEEMIGWVNS